MAREAEALRSQVAQLQEQQAQAELDIKGLTLANTGAQQPRAHAQLCTGPGDGVLRGHGAVWERSSCSAV